MEGAQGTPSDRHCEGISRREQSVCQGKLSMNLPVTKTFSLPGRERSEWEQDFQCPKFVWTKNNNNNNLKIKLVSNSLGQPEPGVDDFSKRQRSSRPFVGGSTQRRQVPAPSVTCYTIPSKHPSHLRPGPNKGFHHPPTVYIEI